MSDFLPSTKFINVSRVVTGTVNVEDSDQVLDCDTTSSAVTVNLKQIPANYWSTLYRLYVKDYGNNAATNNITIVAPAGYKINGANSLIINTNGASSVIQITTNTDYICTVGMITSGGTIITVTNTATVNLTLTPISGGYNIQAATIQQIFYTDQITPITVDSNGLRILYPFTAPSTGTYIFDATTLTDTGNVAGLSDLTTFTVVNGVVVANSNSPYRTFLQSSVGTYDMQVTHNQKVELNLNAGDVFYFGASASVLPVIVSKGSMVIFKKA
jgi:hypothetical protein